MAATVRRSLLILVVLFSLPHTEAARAGMTRTRAPAVSPDVFPMALRYRQQLLDLFAEAQKRPARLLPAKSPRPSVKLLFLSNAAFLRPGSTSALYLLMSLQL